MLTYNKTNGTHTVVSGKFQGLTLNSKHGFHIHQYGDMSDLTSGLSAASHYNPENHNHSLPGYGLSHLGDLVLQIDSAYTY